MSKQEQMFHLIEEYRRSGQSARVFCEQQQLNHSTFQYWLQKERRNKTSAFVPIKVKAVGSAPTVIEIVYPNGNRLRLQQFDLRQISQLLKLQ